MTDLSKLVRPLVWENIGRCVGWTSENEDTHLHSAIGMGVFYEVSKGKVGWQVKWHGQYHATELPNADAAKAAAQADYMACILAALEAPAQPAPSEWNAAIEAAAAKATARWAARREHADRLAEMDYPEAAIDAKTVSAKADEAEMIATEILALRKGGAA